MTAYFIARQPILDASGKTFGYELLFRSGATNAYDCGVDGDTATARLLVNTVGDAGLQSIVGDSLAFFNLTGLFLERPEILDILDPERCVLEVLEDVEVTDAVVAGIEAMQAKGFTIALDDFVDPQRFERLLPLAQIVKYDITQHTMPELIKYREIDAAAGRLSLAERVETLKQFDVLKEAGFSYFQGYYFARPRIISGAKLPQNKITALELLRKINDPSISLDELAESISRDVSLSVRTLRYVNSPLCGMRAEVASIRHAVTMMGREPIRNWATLLAIGGMDDKPEQILKMVLTRARFCQLVAQRESLDDDGMYFTIGLLSMIDVLLDTGLEEALDMVFVNQSIRDQLLTGSGNGGQMLRSAAALERPQSELSDDLAELGPLYQQATSWSESTFQLM